MGNYIIPLVYVSRDRLSDETGTFAFRIGAHPGFKLRQQVVTQIKSIIRDEVFVCQPLEGFAVVPKQLVEGPLAIDPGRHFKQAQNLPVERNRFLPERLRIANITRDRDHPLLPQLGGTLWDWAPYGVFHFNDVRVQSDARRHCGFLD